VYSTYTATSPAMQHEQETTPRSLPPITLPKPP